MSEELPIGTSVLTTTLPFGRGQVVDGEVIAKRHVRSGGVRYLVQWGVVDHDSGGEYDEAKWRRPSRIFEVRSGSSDERGQG